MANFDVFERAIAKLQSVTDEQRMNQIVERAGDRQEEFMVQLNIQQLLQGKLSTGAKITPPYTKRTKEFKKLKGQPADRVTLKDTGDWQNSIRVKRFPGKYELVAMDKKSEMLQFKYTPSILGLTDYNLVRVRARVRPLIIRDIRNLLRLRK